MYDDLNRLSQLNYGGYYTYRYTYDKKGNLISLLDGFCNITTTYGYDSIGRLVSSYASNGFGMYQTYDAFNRINKLVYTKGADTEVYRYIYNDKNLIGSVVLPTGKSISNSYDSLNRLVSKQISDAAGLNVSYTYKSGINGTTSALVETVTTAEGIFSYTYDANGNILTVTKNGVLQESYTYDELGQLKTVTRGTDVYEYTYDNGGNILSVKLNGVVTDTYTYGDANWKDLLTAFNGQTITYDAIGNPLQYRDGMYFEWVRGRTLGSIVKDNGNTCINFVVNPDGIRINKNVMRIESGITDYNFEYNGNLLVRQSWNNNVMWFLYDESGNPVGFTLNDTEYYYLKNLQGDITAITDANGTILAKYTYDEWGKILSITDGNGNDVSANASHIANINPLRYRGYYYDSETGFYYLLSRYYDPVTRRFINADGYVSTGQGFTGFNMFAYCGNNPVMYVDPCGTSTVSIWELLDYKYDGSMRDFRRLEQGLPPYAYEQELKKFKNNDGSYSLHDNHRKNPGGPFHEQLLVIDGGIVADVLNEGLSVDASATLITGGWEWDNVDLSLLDFVRASIALGVSDEVIGAQAIAVIWDPSIAFNIGSKTLEISVYVGGYGAELAYANGKLNIGYAGPWGFGISFY